MKIIKERATNTVVFAGDSLSISVDGATNGEWVASFAKADTHELIDGVTLPADFVGGWYTFENGQFTRTEEGNSGLAAATAKAAAAIQAEIVDETQKHLDQFAQSRGYDDIKSACTYALSTVSQFKTEGQRCIDLRDATWSTLYTIMGQVQAGQRPMPSSFVDIAGDLPGLTW